MWYDQAVVRLLSIMFQREAGLQDNNWVQSSRTAAALWLIRNDLMSHVNRLFSLWRGIEFIKSPICWCFYNKLEPKTKPSKS